MSNTSIGKVIIAGAGPGDPELITLKAIKRLQQADVVLADRLVSPEILSTYISKNAELLLVGKDGCNHRESVSQSEINDLLVQYALEGKNVVRLKGGDVAIFSNVLDELIALQSHSISYEIIPGITAASGASAYAGIPLTARHHAKGVRILTYASKHPFSQEEWLQLSKTDDTLVFYMSGKNWYEVAKHLLEHEIEPTKKLAIIQQATTPMQKTLVFDFKTLANEEPRIEFVSPSLLIIGKVVNLHQDFKWIATKNEKTKNYFPIAPKHATPITVAKNTIN